MTATTKIRCDLTSRAAAPGPLDEIPTPLDWLEITVTRVVRNPAYNTAVQATEAQLAQLDASLANDGVDEATRAATVDGLRRQNEQAYPEEYDVQERVLHVHPEAVADVLTGLGLTEGDLS